MAMSELTVIVSVEDLLVKIKHNRDEHRRIFEEAIEGYKRQVQDLLDQDLKRIAKGKLPQLNYRLPVPTDHTEDYDTVIEMLGMHDSPVIDISQSDFACYVRDDWSWKREFVGTVSNYTTL